MSVYTFKPTFPGSEAKRIALCDPFVLLGTPQLTATHRNALGKTSKLHLATSLAPRPAAGAWQGGLHHGQP